MDIKENELFNGIMGGSKGIEDNNILNYPQNNMQSQTEMKALEPQVTKPEVVGFSEEMKQVEMPQPVMPSEFNVFQGQMPQTVEYQSQLTSMNELPTLEPQVTKPEVVSLPEEINEQGKVINHELLENLAKDTNNLVNPNMLVSPIGKQKNESIAEIDEPKVNYEEIKEKKNYAIMIIVFLIIIAGIILLPTIWSIIG